MSASPDSASRLRELFDRALPLRPADRARLLDGECAGDPGLRADLEELLAAGDATGGFLEAAEPPELPERIGPYRLLDRLGRGGMGVVYRARHEPSGGMVALKTVPIQDATLLAGIRREIEALAEVRHPGIVRIVDHGVHRGLPWYAMELHEGPTLHHHTRAGWGRPTGSAGATGSPGHGASMAPTARDHGAPPAALHVAGGGSLAPLLTVVRRLCPALSYLHGEGILHRDLKPANVLVLAGDRPMLIDFGLMAPFSGGRSREALDTHGATLGTAAYMAPEQAAGEALDARTDLYSLGCILYEILTGGVPLPAPSALQMIERRRSEDPPAPSSLVGGVPEELDRLVLSLLARDRRDRIGHADIVAQALAEAGAGVDADPGGTVPRPKPYLYRPGLAGRDAVLERLAGELAEGEGRLLLVGGESGVGKTRLALAFAARAQASGRLVLAGECQAPASGDAGAGAPFHPLRRVFEAIVDRCRERGPAATERLVGGRLEILAPLHPFANLPGPGPGDAPATLAPKAARRRLLAAVADTLLALARDVPTCLVIDDVQWADELTVDLLSLLVRGGRLGGTPLVVLATYRSEEAGPDLQDLRSSVRDADLHLGRLGDGDVASIVSDMLALPEPPAALCSQVARASAGNPFFVAEYLRAAVGAGIVTRDGHGRWQPGEAAMGEGGWERLSVPGSVEAIIRSRLDGLPPDARDLAEVAAILGRTLEADVLAAASGLGGARGRRALATLLAREVLEEAAGELRFVHLKIREAAHESQPAAVRRERHRAAAVAIEARHGAGSPPHQAALGAHWAGAGEASRARACFLAAAREAAARYAGQEAARLYREHLALSEAPSAERVEALSELGAILDLQGARPEALRAGRQALAEADALGLDEARARPASTVGTVLRRMGQLADAMASHALALDVHRRRGDLGGESHVLAEMARVHHQAGRMEEARALYEDAIATSRRAGDPARLALGLSHVAGFHHDQGRARAARACYEEALGILRETGDLPGIASALANIASLDSSAGRTDEALRGYDEALTAARAAGDRGLEGQILGNLAVLHTRAERTGEAEAVFRQALRIAREVDDRYAEGFTLGLLGEIARVGGRLQEARSLYEEALAVHRRAEDARGEVVVLARFAMLELEEGRPAEARRLFALALELHRRLGDRRSEALTLVRLSQLARRAGDAPAARAAALEAVGLIDEDADPIEGARCHVELGHAFLAGGESAVAAHDRAAALAARAGTPAGSDLGASLERLRRAMEDAAAAVARRADAAPDRGVRPAAPGPGGPFP